jgi:hypothetical protein
VAGLSGRKATATHPPPGTNTTSLRGGLSSMKVERLVRGSKVVAFWREDHNVATVPVNRVGDGEYPRAAERQGAAVDYHEDVAFVCRVSCV